MCAITAGRRGRRVLVLELSKKPGAKILISGGGRCNFTNEGTTAAAYISENPHFAKSALSRYTPFDFMDLLASHGLTWHEKTLGQLFCDQGAKAVLKTLLDECAAAGVEIKLLAEVEAVEKSAGVFEVKGEGFGYTAGNLVVATGGISIPQMGSTDFGYRLARQFGMRIVEPRPALVPFIFEEDIRQHMTALAGVAAPASVRLGRGGAPTFFESILFTHKGLSGPAILQISSYWEPGQEITIDLLPAKSDIEGFLKSSRERAPTSHLKTILSQFLPTRLSEQIAVQWPGPLAELSNRSLEETAKRLKQWSLVPSGTEGFKKAEVTKGGVATDALSSKTMEAKNVPGLYFIGECVDVTGWLGGYNFQWAWASGNAAGLAV